MRKQTSTSVTHKEKVKASWLCGLVMPADGVEEEHKKKKRLLRASKKGKRMHFRERCFRLRTQSRLNSLASERSTPSPLHVYTRESAFCTLLAMPTDPNVWEGPTSAHSRLQTHRFQKLPYLIVAPIVGTIAHSSFCHEPFPHRILYYV